MKQGGRYVVATPAGSLRAAREVAASGEFDCPIPCFGSAREAWQRLAVTLAGDGCGLRFLDDERRSHRVSWRIVTLEARMFP